MNIYQKLIEVRKVVPYLQKENNGPQFKYVGSSQVLGNLKAKMDELGLLLIPSVVGHKVSESTVEYMDGNRPKRTTTYFTELDMKMTWVNAENPEERIECPWYGQGVDIAGEKGVGKALTYAEKYFMLKFFNIPTDKDDPDSFQKKHGEESGDLKNDAPTTQKPPEPPVPKAKPMSQAQLGKIIALCGEKHIDEPTGKTLIKERYQKESLKDLDIKEASDFITYLSA